jgi:hypothetical protein
LVIYRGGFGGILSKWYRQNGFLERFRWCGVVEKVTFGDGFWHEKAPGDAEGIEQLFRLVLFYVTEQV